MEPESAWYFKIHDARSPRGFFQLRVWIGNKRIDSNGIFRSTYIFPKAIRWKIPLGPPVSFLFWWGFDRYCLSMMHGSRWNDLLCFLKRYLWERNLKPDVRNVFYFLFYKRCAAILVWCNSGEIRVIRRRSFKLVQVWHINCFTLIFIHMKVYIFILQIIYIVHMIEYIYFSVPSKIIYVVHMIEYIYFFGSIYYQFLHLCGFLSYAS